LKLSAALDMVLFKIVNIFNHLFIRNCF